MVELTILGTKGEIEEWSKDHKHNSSLLIKTRDKKLLIDLGHTFANKLKEIDPDFILLTHSHLDHVGGITEETDIPVYATELTFKSMDQKYLENIKNKKILKSKERNEINGIIVIPYPVSHSIKHPTDGFIIEVEGKRIGYFPDYIHLRNYKEIWKDLDVLFMDGSTLTTPLIRRKDKEIYGHAMIPTIIRQVEKTNITNLIFTHLGKELVEMGDQEALKKIRALVKKEDLNVRIAKDGEEIDLEKLEKIAPVVPKIIVEVPEYTAGLILVKPHGTMIIRGEKKLIVKSRKFLEHIGEPLLLIEDKKALGIIRLQEPREITQEEFKELEYLHKITPQEAKEWGFLEKDILYAYNFDLLSQYAIPKPVDYPRGPQVFVDKKNIKFLSTEKDHLIDHIVLHLLAEEEEDLEDLILKHREVLSKLPIHPKSKKGLILDRELLIFDIGKYDPSKSDNAPLRDDKRIVDAWYSTIRRGRTIRVHEHGKEIVLSKDNIEKIISLSEKIVREIAKRVKAGKMNYTFSPHKMKKYPRELFEEVRKRIKDLELPIEEKEKFPPDDIRIIDDVYVSRLTDQQLIELYKWLHDRWRREHELLLTGD